MNKPCDPCLTPSPERRLLCKQRRMLVKEIGILEPRLRLKAVSLQRRCFARRLLGASMIGAEVDDLVQHAIERVLSDRPPFDPKRQLLFHYLQRRMEDELKRILALAENSAGNRFLSIDEETDRQRTNVISFEQFICRGDQVETEDYATKFMMWLESGDPTILKLARIMVYEGILHASEQAAILKLEVNQVYRLRERLRELTVRFDARVTSVTGKRK